MKDEKKRLPNYYSIREIEESYNITRRTVLNIISAKDVKTVKVGGSVRIPESEIHKFME